MSADNALKDLKHGRLKVARFRDLNDPFELIAVNFKERPIRKAAREFKSTTNSQMGLLCFSADWWNPLLWSHYAEKHRGMCLGFDVPRRLLETVEYESERIWASLSGDEDPRNLSRELQEKLRRTKYEGWRYEEEQRRFVSLKDATVEGSLHFWPFGEELQLAEVILGPECNDHEVRDVRKLVTRLYPGAVTFKAKLALKFFKILPKEDQIP